MARIASGIASEGRRLRSIFAAGLLSCLFMLTPSRDADAQVIAFPATDNNQLALAGTPLPQKLRVTDDGSAGTNFYLWEIVSDGTGGALMSGAGSTFTSSTQWIAPLTPGATGGPTLTLGSSEGSVTINVCRIPTQTVPPVPNCISTPVSFVASTVVFEFNWEPGDTIDRNQMVFVNIDTYVAGSKSPSFQYLNFAIDGPAIDFFNKGPSFLQFRADPAALDTDEITLTASLAEASSVFAIETFPLTDYVLEQTSPQDDVQAQAGSTITLTVDALRNGEGPDGTTASQTVSWQVLGKIPPGTSLTGRKLTATSQVTGTTATIGLTIGQPNISDEPIIVRATAFEFFGQPARRGNFSLNERTIEFVIDGVDVLEVNAEAGDNQSAQVGDSLTDPLEVEVLRNGNPDGGRQIDWTVSPANGVTFANGASTATTNIGSGGESSVVVSSVNVGGTIIVTATHADDSSASDTFTVTGIAPVLALTNATGDGQFAAINTAFPQPLGITATRNGYGDSSALIDWSVSPAGAATLGTAQTSTDMFGVTSNTITAGPTGGPFTVIATRHDDPTISYTYNLTAIDKRLTKPTSDSGDGQTGEPGSQLPLPLVVIATNNGAPAIEVPISWSVSGDAVVSAPATFTGNDGRSSVTVTLGPSEGTVTVVASRDDAPGTTTSFVLTSQRDQTVLTLEKPSDSGDGTSAAPGAQVQISAVALADGVADPDVRINWTVLAGGGRLRQTSTITDPDGFTANVVTLPDTARTTFIRAVRADRPAAAVDYTLTAVEGGVAILSILEGDGQVSPPGQRGDPLGVRLTQDGIAVPDATINWTVTAGSAQLDQASSTTNVDGVARVGFVFGATPGPVRVRAATGNLTADFSLEVEGDVNGVALRLVSGANQTGAIGTRADQPIVVEVVDGEGAPVPGLNIGWEIVSGSATLDFPAIDTDQNGRAAQGLTFGTSAGPIVVRASLFDGAVGSVNIPATSYVPGITIVSGNNQTGPVSSVLAADFVVAVGGTSSNAKALGGVPIRWSVTQGGGTLSTATSVTDANGRAINRLTLGSGAGLNRVTASIDGGGSVVFDATGTLTSGPLAIVSGNNQTLPTATDSAPLVVELRSASGQVLAGATIDWSGSNVSFVDDVTTTVTDAQGRSSNRVRIALPGAAAVIALVRGSSSNRVTFTLDGGVANTPQLNQPQETVADAIDILCPALEGATNLTPEQQDLLDRCLELVNNAGDNPDQVQDALDQYEQDVSIALADAALGGLNAQFDNVRQRISQVRSGRAGVDLSGLGVATSTGLMPLSFLPSVVQGSDEGEGGGSTEVGADFGRWGFFASGIIGRAEQDGGSNSPKYDYDTTGLTAGVDYRVNESLVLGAAFGYTQQDTELGDGGGDVDAKGWSITGYSTWYHSTNWYLDGVLSFGNNDYDLRRGIFYQIVGSNGAITQVDQIASASTSGDQLMGSISGGRDFQKGAWSFGPYLRASYQRVEFDGYDEELEVGAGSGLGLSVESRALKSMTGVLGGKVSYAMSRDWGILLPYAQLEWEHEFKDDPQQVVTRFLYDPTGTIIRLNGQEVDTDYFNVGIGLSAVFSGGRSGFIYYERVAGSEGLSQDSLSLGLRFEF